MGRRGRTEVGLMVSGNGREEKAAGNVEITKAGRELTRGGDWGNRKDAKMLGAYAKKSGEGKAKTGRV